VCHDWWKTEAEVSAHVEECLSAASTAASLDESSSDGARGDHSNSPPVESTQQQELGEAVSMLLSGGPSNATLDVFVRLLRNILSDTKAEKFRRVRLSNPKIRDTVGMALGGVEFLESVGFNLIADGDEVVAVMDEPSESQIEIIKQAVVLLDPCVSTTPVPSMTLQQLSNPANQLVSRKVDRQVRAEILRPPPFFFPEVCLLQT
jgi:UBX domain-containing protein 6